MPGAYAILQLSGSRRIRFRSLGDSPFSLLPSLPFPSDFIFIFLAIAADSASVESVETRSLNAPNQPSIRIGLGMETAGPGSGPGTGCPERRYKLQDDTNRFPIFLTLVVVATLVPLPDFIRHCLRCVNLKRFLTFVDPIVATLTFFFLISILI